jgi:2'-5' RNA ligase
MASDAATGRVIALIPDNPRAFTVPGGDPVREMHCTLAYLGEDLTGLDSKVLDGLREQVQRLAARTTPITTRVLGAAVWNRDGGPDGDTDPATVTQLTGTLELHQAHLRACDVARETLGSALFPSQHQPYVPHVTAGYGLPETVLPTAKGEHTFSTLRLAVADKTYDYPLSQQLDSSYTAKGTQEMADATTVQEGEPEVTIKDGKLDLHWPCLVIEGMRTGDGRFIPYGKLGARGLPLPVAGQVTNDEGHKGAEVFGKITKLERHEGPTVISKETGKPFPEGTAVWEAWGEGNADSKPGQLAADEYLTGNSADIADATVEEELADGRPQANLVGGKIGGTTLVPIPAFADGFVEVNGKAAVRKPALEAVAASAWTVMDPEPPPVTASADRELPPLAWFTDPQLPELTPLTRDGQHVYGHIADWNRPHISYGGRQVFAERSRADYRFFNTGAYQAVDEAGNEKTVAVGRLTIGGGHANTALDHKTAVRLYDDEATAWAYVQAGEDQFGIWVNGVIKDGVDDLTVRKALAHPASGDWRPIDGHLELVAAHCVNTAGIPVVRARVASGRVVALVAAGYVPPSSTNPDVLAEHVAELTAEKTVRAFFDELETRREQEQLTLQLQQLDLVDELADTPDIDVELTPDVLAWVDHLAADNTGLPDLVEELARRNWVAKAGGLPKFVKRIQRHLEAKGMTESHAIATAINVIKKMCANPGDRLNFPGSQKKVNPASIAQACAAFARWEAMKAKARAD